MAEGKNVRVGLFDSGVGGLTVLRACKRELPRATFFYYGDNGNAPYGNRPREEITALVDRGVEALLAEGVDAVVLACNTATAVCAEGLRRRLCVPVIGMEPAVKPAAERYRDILVLATPRTAESERLKVLIQKFPQCNIGVFAAAGLAGAIEGCLTRGEKFALDKHLPPAVTQAVVLGCTHYVFFRREIAAHYAVPVYDGNSGAARRLKGVLGGLDGDGEWSETTKTNKSLPFEWSECGEKGAVFLGKWAQINEKVYKQTFGTG